MRGNDRSENSDSDFFRPGQVRDAETFVCKSVEGFVKIIDTPEHLSRLTSR
jgi:hypothetical protein